MGMKELCVLACLLLAICEATAPKDRNSKPYNIVCYLGSWANYRQGEGKFLIEDIDPFLCTHAIYGFAKLNANKIAAYDPYLDLKENWGLGAYDRFNGLKKKNPELVTIIAIGGWNEGSVKYSAMAKDAATRKIFIDSVLEFLDKYGFDGLDMDWEYPANRGGAPEDKQNFILLLSELKRAFEPKGYMLTAAVAAGEATMETAYDIKAMGEHLDIINVMAYDLHGSWEKFTGHNAPLFPRADESGDQRKLNVKYAMDYWIAKGAPKKKLVLGMGSYGRSFTLANPSNNGFNAPTTGPGTAGPITREGGMLGYNELCSDGKWTTVWHEDHQVPYAYSGNQWVGYDDPKSIKLKAQYAKDLGLGGGMVWSVETDDFRGKCHGHKYPLLTVIHETLNGAVTRVTVDPNLPRPSTNKEDVVTEPPKPITDTDDGVVLECSKPGYFRHPKDCKKFYHCQPTGGSYKITTFNCGEGTVFNENTGSCDFPHNVKGC